MCGLLAALACTPVAPTPRPPVDLSLQFVPRGSCGRVSPLDYDTSCLAAIYVRALDVSRTTLVERCVELDNGPASLREVLQGDALVNFAGLSTNTTVSFEVRGFHSAGLSAAAAGTLCDRPAQKDQWLFWGESAAVDLAAYDASDAGTALVAVVVDCRDCAKSCPDGLCFGCAAIDVPPQDDCPAVFPPSVCGPASAQLCAIGCSVDADCFEGARRCVNDRCESADTSGTLCSTCAPGGSSCAQGFACVAPIGADHGFCAPPCPDQLCVAGTQCTRLGDVIDVLP